MFTDRQLEIIATCLELATEYGNGDGEIASVSVHLEGLGDWFEEVYALQALVKKDEDAQESEVFLRVLDGMIESTEEFIGDDGLRADDQRIHDLSAALCTHELYTTTFAPSA